MNTADKHSAQRTMRPQTEQTPPAFQPQCTVTSRYTCEKCDARLCPTRVSIASAQYPEATLAYPVGTPLWKIIAACDILADIPRSQECGNGWNITVEPAYGACSSVHLPPGAWPIQPVYEAIRALEKES